jgi:hypothetical protein
MAMLKDDRALEELAIRLAAELEEEDPPKGMEERLFQRIQKEAPPSASKPIPLPGAGTPPPSRRHLLWYRIGAAASVLLLILYASSLYENNRIKKDIATNNEQQKLAELGIELGDVEKTVEINSVKDKVHAKIFVTREDNGNGKKIIMFGTGLRKNKEDDVMQVWVQEEGKTRTVGAMEPTNKGKTTFASDLNENEEIERISVTLEDEYNQKPKGRVLLTTSVDIPKAFIDSNNSKKQDKQSDKPTDKNKASPVAPKIGEPTTEIGKPQTNDIITDQPIRRESNEEETEENIEIGGTPNKSRPSDDEEEQTDKPSDDSIIGRNDNDDSGNYAEELKSLLDVEIEIGKLPIIKLE